MSITDILGNADDLRHVFVGVTVGIVTDIDDPDKLGRIKVKLLNRDKSTDETDFIRIASPMVGRQWGMFFFPEVGDEVLVAFGHGNIERPYVIGSLWNQNYKPPVEIQEKQNKERIIKTKSGHELIFHDEDQKDSIEIHTPKKLTVRLDDANEIISIKDKMGNNIMKIDAKNGIITVTAEKQLEVESGNAFMKLDATTNKITIESPQSLHIKSQQINIESTGTLNLTATSSINIKSDSATKIKGASIKLN